MPVDDGNSSEQGNSGGRKVLVVDDNIDAADSLAMVMRQLGYRVQTAYTGPEAISVAKRFAPRVVLLDLGMPGMNGYEAARLIREQPGGHEVLLIALTGWSQSHVREATVVAGFDLHLVKPVDLSELHRLLSVLPNDPSLAERVAR